MNLERIERQPRNSNIHSQLPTQRGENGGQAVIIISGQKTDILVVCLGSQSSPSTRMGTRERGRFCLLPRSCPLVPCLYLP